MLVLLQPQNDIVRGGAVVARWAHNPKVGGSIPSPATEMDLSVGRSFFCARWAHNPKVGGWLIKLASQSTIPSPATEMDNSLGLSFLLPVTGWFRYQSVQIQH